MWVVKVLRHRGFTIRQLHCSWHREPNIIFKKLRLNRSHARAEANDVLSNTEAERNRNENLELN